MSYPCPSEIDDFTLPYYLPTPSAEDLDFGLDNEFADFGDDLGDSEDELEGSGDEWEDSEDELEDFQDELADSGDQSSDSDPDNSIEDVAPIHYVWNDLTERFEIVFGPDPGTHTEKTQPDSDARRYPTKERIIASPRTSAEYAIDPLLLDAKPGEMLIPEHFDEYSRKEKEKHLRYVEDRKRQRKSNPRAEFPPPDPIADRIFQEAMDRGFVTTTADTLFTHLPSETYMGLVSIRSSCMKAMNSLVQDHAFVERTLDILREAIDRDEESIAFLEKLLAKHTPLLEQCLEQANNVATTFAQRAPVTYGSFHGSLSADGTLIQAFVKSETEAWRKKLEETGVAVDMPETPVCTEDDIIDRIRQCPCVGSTEGTAWLLSFVGPRFVRAFSDTWQPTGTRTHKYRGPLSTKGPMGKVPPYKLGWSVALYNTPRDKGLGPDLPNYFPNKLMLSAAIQDSPALREKYPTSLLRIAAEVSAQCPETFSEWRGTSPPNILFHTQSTTNADGLHLDSTVSELNHIEKNAVSTTFKDFVARAGNASNVDLATVSNAREDFKRMAKDLDGHQSLFIETKKTNSWHPHPFTTVDKELAKLTNLAQGTPGHERVLTKVKGFASKLVTVRNQGQKRYLPLVSLMRALAQDGRFSPSDLPDTPGIFPQPMTVEDCLDLLPNSQITPTIMDNYLKLCRRGHPDCGILNPSTLDKQRADPNNVELKHLIGSLFRPHNSVARTVLVCSHDQMTKVHFLEIYTASKDHCRVIISAAGASDADLKLAMTDLQGKRTALMDTVFGANAGDYAWWTKDGENTGLRRSFEQYLRPGSQGADGLGMPENAPYLILDLAHRAMEGTLGDLLMIQEACATFVKPICYAPPTVNTIYREDIRLDIIYSLNQNLGSRLREAPVDDGLAEEQSLYGETVDSDDSIPGAAGEEELEELLGCNTSISKMNQEELFGKMRTASCRAVNGRTLEVLRQNRVTAHVLESCVLTAEHYELIYRALGEYPEHYEKHEGKSRRDGLSKASIHTNDHADAPWRRAFKKWVTSLVDFFMRIAASLEGVYEAVTAGMSLGFWMCFAWQTPLPNPSNGL